MESLGIAVVGGGASGLAAAIAASDEAKKAGRKLKVAVLEKNPRVGKKLLMTGNGHCNLTNRYAGPESYHGDVDAVSALLERCPAEKVVEAFRSLGLLCRETEEGRIYPYSMQASSVLNVLRRNLEMRRVETICGFPVERIESLPGGFLLHSGKNCICARRVVVAAGGKACPQSGSDGSGYGLLKPLGHSVTGLYPALVPIRTDSKRVRPLKGVRCPAAATLSADGKTFKTVRGEVQFTESALSGICIFELSRYIGRSPGNMEISLDLAPEYSVPSLAAFLREQPRMAEELPPEQILEGAFPKSLGLEVVKNAGSDTRPDFTRIARDAKNFRFPVLGTLSWPRAQVTAGGIPLAETDAKLQSRCRKGLFLCGEILNLDGACGGFNLHWAWVSGTAAGRAAARSLWNGENGNG